MLLRRILTSREYTRNFWASPSTQLTEYRDFVLKSAEKLEEQGREISFHREGTIGRYDLTWFMRLTTIIKEMGGLVSIIDQLTGYLYPKEVIESIKEDIEEKGLIPDFRIFLYTSLDVFYGYPRSTPLTKLKIYQPLARALAEFDESVILLAELVDYPVPGTESFTHLLHQIPKEEYTWSAYVNDVTAVFHTYLDICRHILGAVVPIDDNGSVLVVRDYDKTLADFALAWWDAVCFYSRYGNYELYYYDDISALSAIVTQDRIEFKVGDSPGHRTQVSRDGFALHITYYDTDKAVNSVFSMLCEYYGVRVIEFRPKEKVEARIPVGSFGIIKSSAFNFFASVLPFVTSMDMRIIEPFDYWSSEQVHKVKEELEVEYYRLKPRRCIFCGGNNIRFCIDYVAWRCADCDKVLKEIPKGKEKREFLLCIMAAEDYRNWKRRRRRYNAQKIFR